MNIEKAKLYKNLLSLPHANSNFVNLAFDDEGVLDERICKTLNALIVTVLQYGLLLHIDKIYVCKEKDRRYIVIAENPKIPMVSGEIELKEKVMTQFRQIVVWQYCNFDEIPDSVELNLRIEETSEEIFNHLRANIERRIYRDIKNSKMK